MLLLLLRLLHLSISCIASFSYWPIYSLDHVHAEPESEVQVEEVQKKYGGLQATSYVDTNISFEQDKPRCIPPLSLAFIFVLNHYNYVVLDCALSLQELCCYRSCIMVIVTPHESNLQDYVKHMFKRP
jgi:hypothetical protein